MSTPITRATVPPPPPGFRVANIAPGTGHGSGKHDDIAWFDERAGTWRIGANGLAADVIYAYRIGSKFDPDTLPKPELPQLDEGWREAPEACRALFNSGGLTHKDIAWRRSDDKWKYEANGFNDGQEGRYGVRIGSKLDLLLQEAVAQAELDAAKAAGRQPADCGDGITVCSMDSIHKGSFAPEPDEGPVVVHDERAPKPTLVDKIDAATPAPVDPTKERAAGLSKAFAASYGQDGPKFEEGPTNEAGKQPADRIARHLAGQEEGRLLRPPKGPAVLLDFPDVREACNLESGADVAARAYKDDTYLIKKDVSDPTNPRVDARSLHEYLGSKQDFSNWFKNRMEECDLVKDEDYGVCSINLSSKECGVERKGRGGHNAVDYWLTLDAASEAAMMERNEQGKKARKHFIACKKELLAIRAEPQLPNLRDPDVLLHYLYETSGNLITARGAIDKLVGLNIGLAQENIELEGAKEQLTQANVKAVAKKVEAESVAAELARLAALEAEALPLSAWIARNTHIHGHGPNIGLKMLRALGPLHREIVKGCRKTTETRIRQDLVDDGILFYSSKDFMKTRKLNDTLPAEPVTDGQGKQIIGESRVVLVVPGKGDEFMMDWFMRRPECVLRRLIQHRTEATKHLGRLNGRYAFMECDSNAWDELSLSERRAGVRLNQTADGWHVWCEGPHGHPVHGRAITLTDALVNLANNFYSREEEPDA